MNIDDIKILLKKSRIRWSTHCLERMQERDINIADIENCVMFGEIIENYPDDLPQPSCLIFGYTLDARALHTVVGSDEKTLYIITAYYPNTKIFMENLKTRKER